MEKFAKTSVCQLSTFWLFDLFSLYLYTHIHEICIHKIHEITYKRIFETFENHSVLPPIYL